MASNGAMFVDEGKCFFDSALSYFDKERYLTIYSGSSDLLDENWNYFDDLSPILKAKTTALIDLIYNIQPSTSTANRK